MKLSPLPKTTQQAAERPPESITGFTESRTNRKNSYPWKCEPYLLTGFSQMKMAPQSVLQSGDYQA